MKRQKMSIIIFSITGVIFLTIYIAIFPTIKTQFQSLDQLIQSMPRIYESIRDSGQ